MNEPFDAEKWRTAFLRDCARLSPNARRLLARALMGLNANPANPPAERSKSWMH
jgi:hypothetical protein